MIIGIGLDITNITRIEKTLERFGKRFKEKVFTDYENGTANLRKNYIEYYAKRWAAKEACCKALGTGVSLGIGWKDIATWNHSSGRPAISLSGLAEVRLKQIIPEGYEGAINVSFSDDHPFAQAIVIIEAIPISYKN
jgi:holo-[acyl-carrier protein] synthase